MKIHAIPAPPLSCCHTCGKERDEEDGGAVLGFILVAWG